MVITHTYSGLDKLRENGRIVSIVHNTLKNIIEPGISTMELENIAKEIITSNDAEPGFLGYKGYEFCTCISINDEIVHGLPSNDKILADGDLVTVDVGTYKHGYYGDAAFSMGVGTLSKKALDLLNTTYKSLDAAVRVVREGVTTGTIGRIIESYAKSNGYSVVKSYCGHAIGKELHEEPRIYNFGRDVDGTKLIAGMCICIEPMLCIGSADNHRLSDGWTVVTDDGSLSAHVEHQIIVHKNRAEVITI